MTPQWKEADKSDWIYWNISKLSSHHHQSFFNKNRVEYGLQGSLKDMMKI